MNESKKTSASPVVKYWVVIHRVDDLPRNQWTIWAGICSTAVWAAGPLLVLLLYLLYGVVGSESYQVLISAPEHRWAQYGWLSLIPNGMICPRVEEYGTARQDNR